MPRPRDYGSMPDATAPHEAGKTVLFICTGNIYRSRYAEAYFNHRARALGLTAQAISRGLRTDLVTDALSPFAAEAMRERGIAADSTAPSRRQLAPEDLERADLVIALREAEHRPMFAERFPAWEERVRYWDVADRDEWSTVEMVEAVEQNMERLFEELRRVCSRRVGLVDKEP